MSRARIRRRGFTIIEMTIAATVFAVVAGSITMATSSAMGSFEQSSTAGAINASAARSMDRIVRELIGARHGNLTPPPDLPFGTDNIEYELSETTVNGNVTWGGRRRIALQLAGGELDNGLDDNNNGLIDERSIVRIDDPGLPTERRFVIANGVREFLEGETDNAVDDNGNGLIDERGLSFAEVDGNLVIRLSIEMQGSDGRVMTRTQEVEILLRNR